MKYLLDTNIVLKYFKNIEPEATKVAEILLKHELYFSPIVVAEILAGSDKSQNRQLMTLVSASEVLPIELRTSQLAGEIRNSFLKRKTRILLLDCFIAAQAKLHNLILVTNNVHDYPIKGIKLLNLS